MNLLPKSSEEFANKEYWNNFFRGRGKSLFDWYGEYPELCGILGKYIKTKDNILVIGCGNSKLSIEMFDVGYKSMTNIDISEVVIKQMQKSFKDRLECLWLTMDATEMKFPNESFTVVLDKGTLDAMMSEESDNAKEVIRKYFMEVKRVLKNGGRFVCISLLQEHIIKELLEFFPQNDFLFRIVRCLEAEQKTADGNEDNSSMPVFMIIATKFSRLPMKILELSQDGETIERLPEAESLITSILTIQRASIIRNGLIRKSNVDDEINFDLFRPNEKNPRYSLYILDQKDTGVPGKYAAFIVPLGRETEWMFSTKAGRQKLLASAQHVRLAICTMHRDQTYTSLDDVQSELNDCVKSFAPKECRDSKIPFLSLGADVGKREVIFKGSSQFSGEFVIEDVTTDDNKLYRRLIFLSNQSIIQSEALLKSIIIKKKRVAVVDHSYLSCRHHLFMVLGTMLAQSVTKQQNPTNLLIGLGGGGLCNYIMNFLSHMKTVAVEIDPEICTIAKEHFGLVEDGTKLKIVVEDGMKFLKETTEKFESILFDVDSKDSSLGLSCPPKQFLESEVLQSVKSSLSSDGVFILNLVCRDNEIRESTIKDLNSNFPFIWSYKLEEDLNEIFYCWQRPIENFEALAKTAAKKLNTIKKGTFEATDIEELLEKLSLESSK
ncbi:unnamed protein product [Diamesa hyperborea]